MLSFSHVLFVSTDTMTIDGIPEHGEIGKLSVISKLDEHRKRQNVMKRFQLTNITLNDTNFI